MSPETASLTPMDRAPKDPRQPVAGPGQWPRQAPEFAAGEAPRHVAIIMDGMGAGPMNGGLRAQKATGPVSMRFSIQSPGLSTPVCAIYPSTLSRRKTGSVRPQRSASS